MCARLSGVRAFGPVFQLPTGSRASMSMDMEKAEVKFEKGSIAEQLAKESKAMRRDAARKEWWSKNKPAPMAVKEGSK